MVFDPGIVAGNIKPMPGKIHELARAWNGLNQSASSKLRDHASTGVMELEFILRQQPGSRNIPSC
jgi:hypothetical protein